MAGSEAAIQLKPLKTKVLRKGQLAHDLIEVAEADYPVVLRGIAAQELNAQIAIGNKPSNIIVDGRPNKPISQAMYSVRVFFLDVAAMIAAAKSAYDELQRINRRVTGRTAGLYEVYTQTDGRLALVGSNPNSLNSNNVKMGTGIYIVGPMVPFTRKYRYMMGSGTKARFRRSKAKRYSKWKARDKPLVQRSIHELAAMTTQRKFVNVNVVDTFIQSQNLNTGGKTIVDRVPAVAIWSRRRGRI